MDPSANDQILVSGNPVSYEVTLEPTRQQWVFAMDLPKEWSLERTFMGPQQQLARITPIEQRIAYTVVSYPEYFLQADLSSLSRQWYTSVPDSGNQRSATLARQMRENAGSDTAYIDAVLAKFHEEEYFYTLQPPPLGSNPVDRFLFDTQQGFCEHYASAFAFMMRSAGIPSRIVLGYQGGEINPIGGHVIVRQSDAHAWTEVWLENDGWTRVDPTSAVAPERISVGMSDAMFNGVGVSWGLMAPSEFFHQVSLTWDALNAAWNEWILGYGPENQNAVMEWLGMEDPDWRQMMLTLLAVIAVIIMAISFLLIIRYRPPAKDKAAVLYRQFTKRARLAPNRGESPLAYATRLGDSNASLRDSASDVTARYLVARYGPPTEQSIADLRAAVKNFSST